MAQEIDAIVADYEAGMGCVLLARKYGVADNTVLVHLKRAGVELRAPRTLAPRDIDRMIKLRGEGWTLEAIGAKFGVTRQTVAARLRRLGASDADEQSG